MLSDVLDSHPEIDLVYGDGWYAAVMGGNGPMV